MQVGAFLPIFEFSEGCSADQRVTEFFPQIAFGDIPLSGAGYFVLGDKVTKPPPKPLWFRTSRLDCGSCVASEEENVFGRYFSHHKPSSVSSPAGPRLVRLRNLSPKTTDEVRRSLRCYAAAPLVLPPSHHRTMNCKPIQRHRPTVLFVSPFVGRQAH